VGHMPLTGFELRGQVAFIVDQAREVVGLRVEGRQVAVCVVGDRRGRRACGVPPSKSPCIGDRDEAVRAASSDVVRVGQVVDERRRVVAALCCRRCSRYSSGIVSLRVKIIVFPQILSAPCG
jgi:hypothetical protein